MNQKKYWNETMETMSASDLKALETKALKAQLKYVYEKSDFYRNKGEYRGNYVTSTQRDSEEKMAGRQCEKTTQALTASTPK